MRKERGGWGSGGQEGGKGCYLYHTLCGLGPDLGEWRDTERDRERERVKERGLTLLY